MRPMLMLTVVLIIIAGCSGPSAKPIIYPNQELQPTAIALATNVPPLPRGIETMTLEERVEIYTGLFKADRFLGYEDIVTVTVLPSQICEPDDSVEALSSILTEQVQFFINGNLVTSIGYGYFYTPGDTCFDIPSANAQVNARLAPGLHLVTIRIDISTQSRTIEYTGAVNVERGSAVQDPLTPSD